jgi:hypothetical protein
VSPVVDAHGWIGYAVPTGFALLTLWAVAAFFLNRAPGGGFWTLLAVMQVVIGLQIIVGGILFLAGGRPPTRGPEWLHYVYGGLFPALVLVAAHSLARRFQAFPWAVFGFAALICFGLTFRALQTGLGID